MDGVTPFCETREGRTFRIPSIDSDAYLTCLSAKSLPEPRAPHLYFRSSASIPAKKDASHRATIVACAGNRNTRSLDERGNWGISCNTYSFAKRPPSRFDFLQLGPVQRSDCFWKAIKPSQFFSKYANNTSALDNKRGRIFGILVVR